MMADLDFSFLVFFRSPADVASAGLAVSASSVCPQMLAPTAHLLSSLWCCALTFVSPSLYRCDSG